jgi:dimeric dUTPase (all-alpha-NTP-PPase superfamily)
MENNPLKEMLECQRRLQSECFGVDPCALTDDRAKGDFVQKNVLMLEDELHELLREVSWKWWATDSFFYEEKFKEEVVDCLHFLLNLILVSGLDADNLLMMYRAKNEINRKRQESRAYTQDKSS